MAKHRFTLSQSEKAVDDHFSFWMWASRPVIREALYVTQSNDPAIVGEYLVKVGAIDRYWFDLLMKDQKNKSHE